MSRIELLAVLLALCAFSHAANAGFLGRHRKRDSSPTEEAMTEEGHQQQEEEEGEKEVCFDIIGCFNMGKPWKSVLRPIPAPFAPEKIPVRMLYFSQPNPSEEHVIETYPNVILGDAPYDASKPTVVITHGFSNNGSAQWLHDLKDAYLGKMDANVMITDWGAGAQGYNYLQVTGNTRVVGRVVARTLQHLMEKNLAEPSRIHLIGHSLGAQISSYIAKQISGIGRLTALDPAQPAFEGYDAEVRLDQSDADFVDVIHTDAKPFIPALGFGMVQPVGHLDFYVNGGFEQPGCIIPKDLPKITNILDLAKFPVEYLSEIKSCNHGRAHQYLIEAFNETDNCIFWGHKATVQQVARTVAHSLTQGLLGEVTALSSTCSKDDCVPIGFRTKQYPLRGTFVVTTNNREPYCISEPGAPIEVESGSGENAEGKQDGEAGPRTPLGKAAAFAKKSVQLVGERIKGLVPFL